MKLEKTFLRARNFLFIGYFLIFVNQAAAEIIDLGDLSDLGGPPASFSSADGSVIVGTSQLLGTAFKYTANGGVVFLENLSGGTSSQASGISADGSVIFGTSDVSGGNYAFKITANDGIISLGTLGGNFSTAVASSSDGSVIIGNSANSLSQFFGFRYTANEGIVSLGVLAGGGASSANGISADGSVIVGSSDSVDGGRAVRYTTSEGMVSLGVLAGGTSSAARHISANGLVIVGESDSTDGQRAFKHTASEGMISLGVLDGGNSSEATGISANGSVIVGTSDSADGERAFKYTASEGMISLGFLGVGPFGSTSSSATGISADGSVIVGNSSYEGNRSAFKYTTSEGMVALGFLDGGTYSDADGISANGSVIFGAADNSIGERRLFIFNNASSSGGSSLVDLENTYTTLYYNGSQLNSLINLKNSLLRSTLTQDCNQFGPNGICVAVGGRYGNVNKHNASEQALNLRLAYRLNSNLKTGIILDQAFNSQDPANYSMRNSQPMVGAYINLGQNADETGFNLRFSGAYHNSRINVSRNILAGAEGGVGTTNLKSNGLLAELSYLKNFSNNKLQLKPFLGFRKTQVQRDGYTENNNISFPISYNSVAQKSDSAILGIKSSYNLKQNLGINLGFGIEHNLKNKMDGYVGTISQVGSFSLKSPKLKKHTAFIDAGFYYDLKENQRFNTNIIYGSQNLNSANSALVYVGYLMGF